METETLVPQQEQTTEETAPALRPWSTPRLMRLTGDASEKHIWYSEFHSVTSTQLGAS